MKNNTPGEKSNPKNQKNQKSQNSEARYNRIHSLLTEKFKPLYMELINESDKHAGHRPSDEGPETHFHLILVSDVFNGLSRIDRARMVNDLLIQERDGGQYGGLHAFSMKLMTPSEHKGS